MSRLSLSVVRENATSKEVAREVREQVRVIEDLTLREVSREHVKAMCKCANPIQVQIYAHNLKFA